MREVYSRKSKFYDAATDEFVDGLIGAQVTLAATGKTVVDFCFQGGRTERALLVQAPWLGGTRTLVKGEPPKSFVTPCPECGGKGEVQLLQRVAPCSRGCKK